jgi:cytochrome c biogenesis protein
MSQPVPTPALPRAERDLGDDLDTGLAISPADIGERLWLLFISMRTGLVLILTLAVLGLIGTLLVQAPAGLTSDPQAYAAWLETLRPKYGGWTNVFDTLGFFSIFSSIWFKGLVVLLTTSILACSVNRAPHLWKQAVHPRTNMSESFFDHAPLSAMFETDVAPAATASQVARALKTRRFRTVVQEDADAGTIHLYADKNRWGPFGTVLAHVSLVFILVGAVVGGATGFRNSEFAVSVGSKVDVGYGTGLTVEAKSFTDSYYNNGSPSDYASELVLYKDGQQVAGQTIRVNQPLRYGDVAFYQSFFGAAAAVKVADAKGAVIYQQGVPLLWTSNDGTRRVGQLVLPDQGLTAYVYGAASGEVDPEIKAGQMKIEVYQAGTEEGAPIASQIVSQGQPVSLAGLEFTFERERQFTGLIVARDPGAMLIWFGTALLVGGIALVFFFPNRRAWALIRRGPGGAAVHVGAVVRHDVTFESEFKRLVDEMKVAPTGPTAA